MKPRKKDVNGRSRCSKATEGNSRAFEFSTTMYSKNEEDAWEDLSMEVGMSIEVAKRSFVMSEVTE